PFADASGVQAMQELVNTLSANNVMVYFTAIQPPVMEMINRCGLSDDVGSDKFFWSTDKALEYICS
ncbi:MAG: sodium-independent anion transporter, partial [Oscillospiraceae bacterium]|nr:sodium-independent anion transporter [Oscillospiraceae bacterium]